MPATPSGRHGNEGAPALSLMTTPRERKVAEDYFVTAEAEPGGLASCEALTISERRAVADRIRREITTTAADILRSEQETKEKLNTVHIKCISLMLIAGVAVGIGMVYLRVVLVPFILAIFFMFVLEPLLFAFLNVPTWVKGCATVDCIGDRSAVAFGERRQISNSDVDDFHDACGQTTTVLLLSVGWKVWTFFSVIVCMVALLSTGGGIVYFLVQAFKSFPIDKYMQSEKFKLVLGLFPHLGTEPDDLDFERMIPWLLQGPLFNALDIALSIISQAFLMLLFLAFLLANDVHVGPQEDFLGIGKKIRFSVRRYIRIKTNLAIAVSVLIGALLWHLSVDLFFVFAFVTFVLYYIPHVGNTVAVIAPLPLVFLDPYMSWMDLLVVFAVPFTVHQLATNLVEPKLLASSLDLHPIVVLISLGFWTTVWGAIGAVLSVPITAVARLILLEVDHPYATPIVWLLQGGGHANPPAKPTDNNRFGMSPHYTPENYDESLATPTAGGHDNGISPFGLALEAVAPTKDMDPRTDLMTRQELMLPLPAPRHVTSQAFIPSASNNATSHASTPISAVLPSGPAQKSIARDADLQSPQLVASPFDDAVSDFDERNRMAV